MNSIEKFLRKLGSQEQKAYLFLMRQMETDYAKVPGVKKLSGYKNLFRVRMGRYRIIFSIKKGETEIVKITKRNEQTYKF